MDDGTQDECGLDEPVRIGRGGATRAWRDGLRLTLPGVPRVPGVVVDFHNALNLEHAECRRRLEIWMSEFAASVGHAGGYWTTVYFDLEDPWLPAPCGAYRAGRGFGFTPSWLRANVKGWHQGGAVAKHPFGSTHVGQQQS